VGEEENTTRIMPKVSAFENLLGRVYIELWELQDSPAMFSRRVEMFVSVFLPSMFQKKIIEKHPHLQEKLERLQRNVRVLESSKVEADALTSSAIDMECIPVEEAEFAGEVWHAVVDVLTEAGFNFPMRQVSSGFDLGKMGGAGV
jgi:hypothetical protein